MIELSLNNHDILKVCLFFSSLFSGSTTPINGLYCCGDSTFLGIGMPAVAASGMIVANSLASVKIIFYLFGLNLMCIFLVLIKLLLL